jgi:FSR family fosmidomycin resistance protein-like MFS transporter
MAGDSAQGWYPASVNDRALATSGVPRPGTVVIPRSVAQAASFSIILSLSFCHLLNDLMQSLVPALYPILKSSYGLSFGQIGVITLTQQCIASMLQPVVGLYTDRRPQPYSLTLGVGFTLVGLLAMSRAASYPAILLAAALIGVGSAVFHPEASRVARMAAGGRYGLAQSLFQVGGNVGSASGPLLAAFVVVPRGQSSIAWFGLAALMAIVVLLQVGAWYARQRAPRRPGVTPAAPETAGTARSPADVWRWRWASWWCCCSRRTSTAPASARTTRSI